MVRALALLVAVVATNAEGSSAVQVESSSTILRESAVPQMRLDAAGVLGGTKSPAAIAPLLQAIEEDAVIFVRVAAVDALARLGLSLLIQEQHTTALGRAATRNADMILTGLSGYRADPDGEVVVAVNDAISDLQTVHTATTKAVSEARSEVQSMVSRRAASGEREAALKALWEWHLSRKLRVLELSLEQEAQERRTQRQRKRVRSASLEKP